MPIDNLNPEKVYQTYLDCVYLNQKEVTFKSTLFCWPIDWRDCGIILHALSYVLMLYKLLIFHRSFINVYCVDWFSTSLYKVRLTKNICSWVLVLFLFNIINYHNELPWPSVKRVVNCAWIKVVLFTPAGRPSVGLTPMYKNRSLPVYLTQKDKQKLDNENNYVFNCLNTNLKDMPKTL